MSVHAIDVLAVMDATAAGLWSVAKNCSRSDLSTAMRQRAEQFDEARAAVTDLVAERDALKAALSAAEEGLRAASDLIALQRDELACLRGAA